MTSKGKIAKKRHLGFFKNIVDNSQLAGLFVDVDRNIKYCNPRTMNLFGYSKPEIVGRRTELLYEDRRKNPKARKEIYNALEKHGVHIGTAQGKRKNGENLDLKLSTFVIRPHKGAVILIEELQKSPKGAIDKERFLQNLLDAIPDMIYFKDLENKFVLVNKAHAAALKLEPHEIVGKSDLNFFPKELSRKYFADDARIIKTGKPVIGKIERAPRPDGGITYVSTTKVPHYDRENKIIGTIGITRNITDKMVAQEELHMYKDHLEEIVKERTEDLRENNKKLLHMYNIKSEFTSVVSHELRTPLTIIKEGIALVEDGTLGELNEKQKVSLKTVLNNIGRLTRLINDILDFSKLESKKMKFRTVEGNLNEIITQVAESYRSSIVKKGLELKMNLSSSLPLVRFDPDRIAQVLYNLVNNAAKFTYKGYIGIESTFDDENIKIAVNDTGSGIKETDLPKVFGRFEQIYPDAGTRLGGTGLGLAICKQIIEQLGGQIFVTSEYGRGSTFTFTLPISKT